MANIYALVDSRNPDAYRYIGKTIKTIEYRLYHHKHKANRDLNLHKVRWMNKVEANGGEVLAVLLEVCDDSVQDEREMHWIRSSRASGHLLTNMSDGGEGGVNPDPDVIARIVAKTRGLKRSDEVRKAISERAKLRIGAANPNFGNRLSDETKRRIVSSRIGVPLRDSHKAKLSEFGAHTVLTPEQATEIYRLAVVEKIGHKHIAARFPVSTKAVSHIATGQRWKHLNLAERFAPC